MPRTDTDMLPYYLENEENFAEFLEHENEAGFTLPDGSLPIFINVYEIDRCYGGPEEGGWWYDAGEVIESVMVSSLQQAQEKYKELSEKWQDEKGANVSSVIYQGGCYSVCVQRHPAKDYPETRPRYE